MMHSKVAGCPQAWSTRTVRQFLVTRGIARMGAMSDAMHFDLEGIARICRARGVRRLSVFGSATDGRD